jgi:Ca2+-binding RTX toxin-like protein
VGGAGNDSYVLDSAADTLQEAAGAGLDTALAHVSYALGAGVAVETLSALAGTRVIHLTGNELANALMGNAAANKLNGAAGNDKLTGGLGNDVLTGGSGNDLLTGGRGRDVMTGGTGKDRFVFDDRDTGASKTTADYLLDFRGSLGDSINPRAVDANAKLSGDQNFAFIGTHAFTKAGQVRTEKAGSYTYVYLNTDADASAEAVIKLKGALDLSKGWFVL